MAAYFLQGKLILAPFVTDSISSKEVYGATLQPDNLPPDCSGLQEYLKIVQASFETLPKTLQDRFLADGGRIEIVDGRLSEWTGNSAHQDTGGRMTSDNVCTITTKRIDQTIANRRPETTIAHEILGHYLQRVLGFEAFNEGDPSNPNLWLLLIASDLHRSTTNVAGSMINRVQSAKANNRDKRIQEPYSGSADMQKEIFAGLAENMVLPKFSATDVLSSFNSPDMARFFYDVVLSCLYLEDMKTKGTAKGATSNQQRLGAHAAKKIDEIKAFIKNPLEAMRDQDPESAQRLVSLVTQVDAALKNGQPIQDINIQYSGTLPIDEIMEGLMKKMSEIARFGTFVQTVTGYQTPEGWVRS
jgi:hypothetical protein